MFPVIKPQPNITIYYILSCGIIILDIVCVVIHTYV